MVKMLYPPVIKFLLRINFKEIESPNIKTIALISDKLSEVNYSESSRINLISSKRPDPQLIFSPMRFISEEEGNEILIFRDSIYFQYNEKYPTWDRILPIILENFFYLAEQLKISLIENISLEYVDLFTQFPQKNFEIKTYFNIKLKRPTEFEMDYDDFIIGIKLRTEEPNHKSILRLRGLKPDNDECYKIQLETHHSITEKIEIAEKDYLKELLNSAHDNLSNNFKLVLTEQTERIIGMDDGKNSE
jgi:uncharacterized protein (TIGR04255 family)